ncbi:hypothetical protein, partial [Klebsiella pneumoniae]|uniref:hypothetical protein n=1 Tax=Klebsiella pneumoniae TaxID=573 RepID=UPI0025A04348
PTPTNLGTESHYQCELWLNSEPCRADEPEVQHALAFLRDQLAPLGARAFRTEWEILSEAEALAGSIDCVAELPDGRLVLVDWKRAAKLQGSLFGFGSKRMRPPFAH